MPRQKSLLRLVGEPLAIALLLAIAVRSVVRVYAIPSESMQPTLFPGDQIAVTPYRFGSEPARGDVVVFRSPLDRGEFVVKRVIATPGDLISTESGCVMIGGHPLAEPYARTATAGVIPPQIVPAGCFFVMGDNRQVSFDSRRWGVLPAAYIVGRARMILWSREAEEGNPPFVTTAQAKSAAQPQRGRLRFLIPIH